MARERGNVRGRLWWLAWGILVVAVLIAAQDLASQARLDALGGSAVVTSEVGVGTRVTGRLPIGVAVAV
jgi:hypothetical protein